MHFATYLHSETLKTSRNVSGSQFTGFSYPHYSQIAKQLAQELSDLPSLPVRRADLNEFRRAHSQEYLHALKLMADGQSLAVKPKLNSECAGLELCLPGYCYGLGGFCEAIDHMQRGSLDRVFIFSLVGHHAHRDWGHGYCLLNPMAAAVRYAQQVGFARVLIVDWDIHHGDGTQAIFAHDPNVHQISIHSGIDLYMLKASKLQSGSIASGQAAGHCNIPVVHSIFDDAFSQSIGLDSGFCRNHDCLAHFEKALASLPFTPQIIFIFAGCDGHFEDCGKDITNWTYDSFRTLTRLALETAKRANCPIVSAQGGGYNLPVTVATTCAHVTALRCNQ